MFLRGFKRVITQILNFKRQPLKMVKHTQAILRQQPTNCLSVLDHFVGLALKELSLYIQT